jgi:putative ABC transport system substrate-binding protein
LRRDQWQQEMPQLNPKRRDLIAGLAVVAMWPVVGSAQSSTMPIIGFLGSEVEERTSERFAAFHKALGEAGYTEGRNVAIEYRWAQGRVDRYPALAAELVARGVSVIASMGGIPSARAIKAATTIIPVVVQGGFDPVETGIVSSLSHPGGNITGVTNLGVALVPKRLEALHQLLPEAKRFALLLNPTHPLAASQSRDVAAAARALGLEIEVVYATAVQDLDPAFASLAKLDVKGIVISTGQPFTTRSVELAQLAVRYRVPAVAESHEFVAAGGLMIYAGSRNDSYALVGQYIGRILKGEKPADLPIVLSTKVELVVNMKAAKALGLNVPLPLLGRADEVIE